MLDFVEQRSIDPAFSEGRPQEALKPRALAMEASLIDMGRAAPFPLPPAKGDTIWMGAVDRDGYAVSFIQSTYWEYGSGCLLPRTGVLMQNRGVSFSLDARSNNPLSSGRKPFHTLNPALAAFSDGRVMPYGTMGGDGHAGALMRDARGRVEAALDPRAGVVRRAVVERTRQLRLTWLTV